MSNNRETMSKKDLENIFTSIQERFSEQDEKFEKRFDKIDKRFDKLESVLMLILGIVKQNDEDKVAMKADIWDLKKAVAKLQLQIK